MNEVNNKSPKLSMDLKKKISLLVLGLLLIFAITFGINKYQNTKSDQGIDYTITVVGKEKKVYEGSTKETNLGNLLDELDKENKDFTVVFEGTKGQGLGRYIVEINGDAQSMDEGKYWMYGIQRDNEDVKDVTGVDTQKIEDEDHITFTLGQ